MTVETVLRIMLVESPIAEKMLALTYSMTLGAKVLRRSRMLFLSKRPAMDRTVTSSAGSWVRIYVRY